MSENIHLDSIETRFHPVLEDAAGEYKKIFGDNLRSVYIQGSVSRGDYVDGISDIDTTCVIGREKTHEDMDKIKQAKADIKAKYPWIVKIDMSVWPEGSLKNDKIGQFIFGTDSSLLYGDQFQPTFEFPEPGLELAQMLNSGFESTIDKAKERLNVGNIVDLKAEERWLAKKALRLILGLTMCKESFYTANIGEIAPRAIAAIPHLKGTIERIDSARKAPLGAKDTIQGLLMDCDEVALVAKQAGILNDK